MNTRPRAVAFILFSITFLVASKVKAVPPLSEIVPDYPKGYWYCESRNPLATGWASAEKFEIAKETASNNCVNGEKEVMKNKDAPSRCSTPICIYVTGKKQTDKSV